MPRTKRKDPFTGKDAVPWREIKGRYLAGEKIEDLAKIYKVPAGTIKSRSYRHSWLGKEMSPRVIKKVKTELIKSEAENSEKIWRERAERLREKEFAAAERILNYAEIMEDQDLLMKVEKVKTASDLGRRAAGIEDKQSNANAINIAVLSDIDFLGSEARIYSKPDDVVEANFDLLDGADKP